jgi:uncharacterized protein
MTHLHVTVAWADPSGACEVSLLLNMNATIADALAALAVQVAKQPQARQLTMPHPESAGKIGVWGRVRPLTTVLRDGDRIELYRALNADPKEARRVRHARNPAKLRP